MALLPSDVGQRVVVRRRDGEREGRPQYSDVLGELLRLDELVVVRREDGTEVTVDIRDVTAGKRIPARPPRRARSPRRAPPGSDRIGALGIDALGIDALGIDALELERIAAAGWQGLSSEWLGGWLLRAGGGWTGRANSVLPLGEPDRALDAAVSYVEQWYAARGLPPTFQLPLPPAEDLRRALAARGWTDRWGAVVMTAETAAVLAGVAPPSALPPVVLADEPDAGWLAAYHYRGGPLPPVAVQVLRTGAHPMFASVVENGTTVAICRAALDDGWIGITAVEVDQVHRRRGLATHLLLAVLAHARHHGAPHAYLQVEDANTAARTLYERAGFTAHHTYRYYRPAGA